MIIYKVVFNNFRQFFGEEEFSLAYDEIKNVTLIHGLNNFGKTTILNGLLWAFCQKFTDDFDQPHILINSEAAKLGASTCYVEIDFEVDGKNFLLRRTYDSSDSKARCTIREFCEGTLMAPIPEPELVINSFLPKEMAEYFFFAGEGSSAINTGSGGSDLTQALRNILGFRVAENVIESLTSHLKIIRKDMSALDTSGEAAALVRELEELESQQAILKNQLSTCESELPKVEENLRITEEKLIKINNTDLASLRAKEREFEKKVKSYSDLLKEAERAKATFVYKFGFAVFASTFSSETLDFIDESQLAGRLPEPYNKTLIEDILKAQECICGNHLVENEAARKKLISLLDKAANPELQSRLQGVRAQIQDIMTLNRLANDELKSTLSNLTLYDKELQQAINSLKAVRLEIEKIPEEEISKLQAMRLSYKKDLDTLKTQFYKFKARLDDIESQIKSKTTSLKSKTVNTEQMSFLEAKATFVEQSAMMLANHLRAIESDVREHIISKLKELIDVFSNNDYTISTSDTGFKIYLVDRNGNRLGQGAGLNLLINLTITAALVNFAINKQKIESDFLTSVTHAPLVIDSPFGKLDDNFREVVVRELPRQVRQIIFLASDSQMSSEMKKVLKERIGAEYYLELHQISSVAEKTPKYLNFEDRKVCCTIFDSEYNCTKIREV
ncbi:hypothetical protein ACO1PK_14880 [Alishewanella sp. d11]|uniref:hypothetical protein n=1 Tax=Alishewanella sp. d11 TaxID=3414030 RepID=UPI003BF79FF9